mmetsp:Transcript_33427/g.87673  ORF Transcript_33427/g.87673 Transcript_33427/m.87673 type:complete len:284 (+) Transcript_33427:2179-3030(+)
MVCALQQLGSLKQRAGGLRDVADVTPTVVQDQDLRCQRRVVNFEDHVEERVARVKRDGLVVGRNVEDVHIGLVRHGRLREWSAVTVVPHDRVVARNGAVCTRRSRQICVTGNLDVENTLLGAVALNNERVAPWVEDGCQSGPRERDAVTTSAVVAVDQGCRVGAKETGAELVHREDGVEVRGTRVERHLCAIRQGEPVELLQPAQSEDIRPCLGRALHSRCAQRLIWGPRGVGDVLPRETVRSKGLPCRQVQRRIRHFAVAHKIWDCRGLDGACGRWRFRFRR